MKKRTAIGLILLAIGMGFLLFRSNPPFREIHSERFSASGSIRWLDDQTLFIENHSSIALWNRTEARYHTFQSSVRKLAIDSIAISSLEPRRVATFDSQYVQVWNLSDQDSFFVWQIPNDDVCYGSRLRFSADGAWLLLKCLLGNKSEVTWLYDLQRGTVTETPIQPWNTLDVHAAPDFEYDQDSQTFQAVDWISRKPIWATTVQHANLYVRAITDAQVVACAERQCYLFDRSTGAIRQSISVSQELHKVFLFEHKLVTLTSNSSSTQTTIALYDTATGNRLRRFEIHQPESELPYHISADVSVNGELAISFYQWIDIAPIELRWSPVYVYDTSTLEHIATLDRHTKGVSHISFDPTGQYLFTGSLDKTFKIWEIQR